MDDSVEKDAFKRNLLAFFSPCIDSIIKIRFLLIKKIKSIFSNQIINWWIKQDQKWHVHVTLLHVAGRWNMRSRKILNSLSIDWSWQLKLSRRVNERFAFLPLMMCRTWRTYTQPPVLPRFRGFSYCLELRLRILDAADLRLEKEKKRERETEKEKERGGELSMKTVKTKAKPVVLTPSSQYNWRSTRIPCTRRGRHYALSLGRWHPLRPWPPLPPK